MTLQRRACRTPSQTSTPTSPPTITPKKVLFRTQIDSPGVTPLPSVAQSPPFDSPCITPPCEYSYDYQDRTPPRKAPPQKSIDLFGRLSALPAATFGIFLLAIICVGLYGEYSALRGQLEKTVAERELMRSSHDVAVKSLQTASEVTAQVQPENRRLKEEKLGLEEQVEGLRRDIAEVNKKLTEARHQSADLMRMGGDATRNENKLKEVEAKAKSDIQRLTLGIQHQSQREAVDRFGPGPHRVEFELEIPDEEDIYSSEAHFMTIEMAPLDVTPQSVNLFLYQVSRKVWDGAEIFLNDQDTLLARAIEQDAIRDKSPDVASAIVEEVPYQEYSKNFSHMKYTLGYAGLPGGPNFHFNKADVSKEEPCFATIVEGMHLVDMISNLPTNLSDKRLEMPAVIRSATIFTLNDDVWTSQN